jgi:beta-glucanase (GH16 family)
MYPRLPTLSSRTALYTFILRTQLTTIGGNVLNPVRSARIYSNFSFLYGRIEVRAKLPVGNWLWPAIWMLPEKNVYGTWPESGEIDIMESRGNDLSYRAGGNDRFASTLHWDPKWNADMWTHTHQEYVDKNNTLTSQWHIYGIKWTSIDCEYECASMGRVSFGWSQSLSRRWHKRTV